MTPRIEVELKLQIAPEAADTVARVPTLAAGEPTQRKQTSVYFDTPDQAVADTQGRDEMLGLGRQRQDRGVIEVVIMVVRQDHGLDRRQLGNADGRLVKTGRAGPLHR